MIAITPVINSTEVSRGLKLAQRIPKFRTLVCGSAFDAALHDAFGKAHGLNCYHTYTREFMNRDLGAWLGAHSGRRGHRIELAPVLPGRECRLGGQVPGHFQNRRWHDGHGQPDRTRPRRDFKSPSMNAFTSLLLAGALALLPMHSASAAGDYFTVTFPASQKPGELQLEATFTVWIPEGVKQLRAVIVHQHGCGYDANAAGDTAAQDLP